MMDTLQIGYASTKPRFTSALSPARRTASARAARLPDRTPALERLEEAEHGQHQPGEGHPAGPGSGFAVAAVCRAGRLHGRACGPKVGHGCSSVAPGRLPGPAQRPARRGGQPSFDGGEAEPGLSDRGGVPIAGAGRG
jgi:hypothetical protein